MPCKNGVSFWNDSIGRVSFRKMGHSLGKYIAYKLGCDENDGNGPMATILGASCTPRKLLSTMARLPGSSGLTQSVSGRLSSRAIGVTSP